MIKKHVADTSLWKTDGSGIDHRKLADAIFRDVDMETSCSCPATLFWGQDFVRTQNKAQYGDQEERSPKIRNPREKGALCKHGDLVFDVLPAYKSTFAKHLMNFFKKSIEAVEQQVRDGDLPDEEGDAVKPDGPAPKKPSGGKKAPPPPIIPGVKTKKKKEVSSPGGSRSATSTANTGATSANGSATTKAGSATKKVA